MISVPIQIDWTQTFFPNNILITSMFVIISIGHIEKWPENIGLPCKNFGATSPLPPRTNMGLVELGHRLVRHWARNILVDYFCNINLYFGSRPNLQLPDVMFSPVSRGFCLVKNTSALKLVKKCRLGALNIQKQAQFLQIQQVSTILNLR